MATLISHFRNEEYLLPWWIKHHRRFFDEAVLIDYHSSDKSREIISRLAPKGWEVQSSVNQVFEAEKIDEEVMAIERQVCGPKIVLNTTEFLVGDITGTLSLLTQRPHSAVRAQGITMVSKKTSFKLDNDQGLLRQMPLGVSREGFQKLRTFSFRRPFELATATLTSSPFLWAQEVLVRNQMALWNPTMRDRIIHTFPDGRYQPGRHTSDHDSFQSPNLFVAWLAASPWTQEFRSRKLAQSALIPAEEFSRGRGVQHLLGDVHINRLRRLFLAVAEPLPDLELR